MNKPYFYIIEHKKTGIKYAGAKWSEGSDPSNFMKTNGYLTSSSKVKEIIEIDGLEAFEILVLKTEFDSNLNAYDYETRWLIDHDCAKSKTWYNRHNNNNRIGALALTEDLKNKRSSNRKEWLANPENLKLAVENMRRGGYKKSTLFSGEGNPFYGKRHSEESRKLISENLKGREVWNTGSNKENCTHARMHSDRMKINNPMSNMSEERKREIYSNRKQRTTKGMKKFYNSTLGVYKMFIPGEEKEGFVLFKI